MRYLSKIYRLKYGYLTLLVLLQLPVFAQEAKVMVIPVVIHIVYNESEQNITDKQALSQISVLNRDYSATNNDQSAVISEFRNLIADTKIVFRLASTDADGNGTTGITRTNTNHGPFGNNDLHQSSLGGKDGWNPQIYLNIWVANLTPGILGYGSPPNTTDYDGVAIHYEYFGTAGSVVPYNLGRTATHEIGHYLGLKHTWGESTDCSDDDGVLDTPQQDRAIKDCNLIYTSCGTLDMTQNFMNTSDDDCLLFFTQGQATRMQNTLVNDRPILYTEEIRVITSSDDYTDVKVTISPNPSPSGVFYMKSATDKDLNIQIRDALGRLLKTENAKHEFTIDLQKWAPGIYYLTTIEGQTSTTNKIIYGGL